MTRNTSPPFLPLIIAARSAEPDTRRKAALQLGDIPDVRAAEELLRLLTDLHTPVRSAARESLRRQGSAGIPALLEGLSHPRLEVAVTSAELLGESPSPEAVGPLLLALKFSERPVQLAARRALGRFGPLAVPALRAALDEPQPWVRQHVGEALAEAEAMSGLTPEGGTHAIADPANASASISSSPPVPVIQADALLPAEINFTCPACGGGVELRAVSPSRRALCPHCGEIVAVPDSDLRRPDEPRDEVTSANEEVIDLAEVEGADAPEREAARRIRHRPDDRLSHRRAATDGMFDGLFNGCRPVGALVFVLGIALLFGNTTGAFPTFSYAGCLTMGLGVLIWKAGDV